MKHLRRLSQALFLLLFLFLLSRAKYPLDASAHEGALGILTPAVEKLGSVGSGTVRVLETGIWKPLWKLAPESFLRLSPLLGVTTMLATRTFGAVWLVLWPAAIVLLAAFVVGRAFCGWVCPPGTTFDIFDRVLVSQKRGRAVHTPRLARVKYLLLAVLLVLALFGLQVAGWFDPLSMATRSYGLVVHPALDYTYRHALEPLIEKSDALAGTLAPAQELVDAHTKWRDGQFLTPVFEHQRLFAGILLGLLLVLFYQKRFWCRNLCPLGALLGLCARTRLIKVSIADTCIDCKACERVCPVGAIKDRRVSPEECTLCWLCVSACPTEAVSIRPALPAHGGERFPVVPDRRLLLKTGALVALSAPILKLNVARRRGKAQLIRPPGAQDEDRLLRLCVRCGECMKACPEKAIHPTGLEAGWEALWTPKLVPRLGFCIHPCNDTDQLYNNLCGVVCPTGAIEKLTLPAKGARKLGTAYVDRSKCIPWVWEKNCGKCEEHCPVPGKAIHFYGPGADEQMSFSWSENGSDEGLPEDQAVSRPYVIPERCIGCGQCENVCPVEGEAAIRVAPPQME